MRPEISATKDNIKSVFNGRLHGMQGASIPVISDGADIIEDKTALKGVPIEAHTN